MSRDRVGVTLIEVVVVMAIVTVVLTIGMFTFSDFFQREAARRAAQVFAQDLVAARSFAVRSQESVVVRFYESNLWYEVRGQSSGAEIARRRFGAGGEIDLSGVVLDLTGDSVVFDARGVASIGGGAGALATARFSSGPITYTVSFNGMGASTIDPT